MSRVDKVTQRNAAAAEQLSSTAEELSAQAEALRRRMDAFRLHASDRASLAAMGRDDTEEHSRKNGAAPAPSRRSGIVGDVDTARVS